MIMEVSTMNRPPIKRNRGERGNSLVEFAVVIWLWTLVLMGTVAIGLALTTILQVVQTSRDLGHMYAAGIDFTALPDTNLLTGGVVLDAHGNPTAATSAALIQGMTLVGPGTNATIIFSQVRHVYAADNDCNNTCTNAGNDVFLNRVVFGNAALHPSVLGNPDSTDLTTKGNTLNYLTRSADATSQFPLFSSPMAAQDVAYVVEVYMTGRGIGFAGLADMGLTTTGNYSRAVF
jgi:hypothetical protein